MIQNLHNLATASVVILPFWFFLSLLLIAIGNMDRRYNLPQARLWSRSMVGVPATLFVFASIIYVLT